MGVKPKKPKYTGNFPGQVDQTFGTKQSREMAI